jgi:O-antigen ligase
MYLDGIDLPTFFFGRESRYEYIAIPWDFIGNAHVRSAHNGYLSLLVDNGIFALAILMIGLISILTEIGKYDDPIAKACLVIVTAFVVREMFEVTFHVNNFPIASLFWYLTGGVFRHLSLQRKNNARLLPYRRQLRASSTGSLCQYFSLPQRISRF